MKRIKSYLTLSLLMAVLVLTGCSKAPESPKLIPSDAFMTARIDVKQMLEKSKAGDNDQVKQKLKDAIGSEQMGAGLKQKLEEIINDPAKAGLDLRNPLFLAMSGNTNDPDFTLTGTVLDSGNLEALLSDIAKEANGEIEEKDGVKYLNDDGVVFAFDDNNFQVARATSTNTLENMLGRFGDFGNDELMESEEMQAMMGKSGVLQVLILGKGFESIYEEKGMKDVLPSDAAPKDLALLIDFNTGKGKVEAVSEVFAKSAAWKDYIKKGDDMLDGIDGDALRYISKEGIVLATSLEGDDIYEFLSKNEAISKQLGREQMPLLEKVLKSIDGDLTIGVNMPSGSSLPNVAAYLKTKDQTLVNEARNNGLESMGIQLGYDKGFTYIVFGNGGAFAEPQNAVSRSDASGKRFYCYVDFGLEALGQQLGRSNRAVLEKLSSLEVSYEKNGKGNALLKLKDDSKDPLELLVETFIEALG